MIIFALLSVLVLGGTFWTAVILGLRWLVRRGVL
jgi:hypothetical protein